MYSARNKYTTYCTLSPIKQYHFLTGFLWQVGQHFLHLLHWPPCHFLIVPRCMHIHSQTLCTYTVKHYAHWHSQTLTGRKSKIKDFFFYKRYALTYWTSFNFTIGQTIQVPLHMSNYINKNDVLLYKMICLQFRKWFCNWQEFQVFEEVGHFCMLLLNWTLWASPSMCMYKYRYT